MFHTTKASSTQAEFAALKSRLSRQSGRRSSGGSFYERSGTANHSRLSIRDNHDYLGIPNDEEETPVARAASTTRKSGLLDRFRSSQRDVVQRRGMSYISPFEPVLNEGDRKVFTSTPKAVLLWDDRCWRASPTSTAKVPPCREARADWGAVNMLYESKTLAGGDQRLDVPEERIDAEGGFEYLKIFSLFKGELWLILVLTILKIFEIVVGITLPIFMALFTDSLLCRQHIVSRYEAYSRNLPAPITQAAFQTMLADAAFCRAQVPPVLGNNCCTGQKDDNDTSPFRALVPLLAPNLRNNLEGFGRIEDLILVQVYFSLVATATRLMLDIGNTYFTNRFGGGLQRKVLDAFLAQDVGFFDARPTGVLLSRIMNDSADVQGVAVIFSMVVRIIAQIAFSATIAYGLNPSLFVLFVCLIPFEFVIMYREGVFSRHWLLISNTRMGKHYQVMQEILDKIKHIKVFNGINAALEQYANSLQLNFRIAAYVNYVTTFGFTLVLTVYQNVFQKSLDYISARLILQLDTVPNSNVPNSNVLPFTTNGRQFSFGDYGQFITYATTLKDSIKEAYSLRQAVNSTLVVTQTMVYFIFRKPVGGSEKTQGPGFVSRIQDVDPTIRFDNVSFAYPSRPGIGVLKKFNVTFPAKKFSCIIGNSGGGKSTTMSLILRMYEPSQGKIWLGKHEYNTVNLTFLRECFAYVTQEPVMFSCTIRENLLYANPLASSEQINHALEEAGCKSIIMSLPDGLETKLADTAFVYEQLAGLSAAGSGLSIGQKQRIAIARAFLRPSPILLLDEPTAALDAKSEELVTAAIVKLVKNRTAIMITHRMTSVRYCDNVVVILDGACVEHGPPSELLQRPDSVFSSFIKQHAEASGRIAGLAAQAGDAELGLEESADEFEALRRISEDDQEDIRQ